MTTAVTVFWEASMGISQSKHSTSTRRSRLQLQHRLRLASDTREPICINLPDIVVEEAMVLSAIVAGVRYGPTDLRAPREFYRFEWEHERELWVGCLRSERVKRVRGGTISLDVLCPLGTLTPETLRRVVQYLRDGTQPECDPVSVIFYPCARVALFIRPLSNRQKGSL